MTIRIKKGADDIPMRDLVRAVEDHAESIRGKYDAATEYEKYRLASVEDWQVPENYLYMAFFAYLNGNFALAAELFREAGVSRRNQIHSWGGAMIYQGSSWRKWIPDHEQPPPLAEGDLWLKTLVARGYVFAWHSLTGQTLEVLPTLI